MELIKVGDGQLRIQQMAIVKIQNHKDGFIWDLFMKVPEIKERLTKLGFKSPNIK